MLNEKWQAGEDVFGRLLGIGQIYQAYYQVKEMSLPWIECKFQCNCNYCAIYICYISDDMYMARCSVYAISEEYCGK